MAKEPRWHQMVKEILKEIGIKRGYDVSKSEQEILLTARFSAYEDEERQLHTLTYKPDVVWRKKNRWRAIFEVEYMNPRSETQVMDKRKYALGSISLGLLGLEKQSCDFLIFVTNSESLCSEMAKYVHLKETEAFEKVLYYYEPLTRRASLTKSLKETLIKSWKI